MSLLQLEREITGIDPAVIFTIFGFPFSNSTLLILFIALIFLIFFWLIRRNISLHPNKTQSLVEIFYEGVFNLVNQVTQNKVLTQQVFPITITIFIYLGVTNLIGIYVPGLTSITYDGVAIFRTPTSDFNTTFGLALGAVFLTHVVSIRDWGIFGHVNKYLQFGTLFNVLRKNPKDIGLALVEFFVGVLDIIGEIAKVISLSLRLFGNLYAGEVLMIVIMGGFAYLLPALWIGMSTLSGVVQAVVFGLLFTAYYALAAKPVEEKKKL